MDKFVDHLPVYRQVQRYERLGIKLSESTLGGWLSSTCELNNPLYDALRSVCSVRLTCKPTRLLSPY